MNFDAFTNPSIVQALNLGNRISVEKLDLIETGTYNPLFARSFNLNTANGSLGQTTNALSERVYQAGCSVTPDLVAGLANGLISPSAEVGNQLSIPYGWDQKRFRFHAMIRVDLANGMTTRYSVQGFTEFFDVTIQSQTLDPNMKFFINSMTQLGQATNTFGQTSLISQGNTQILNGAIVQTPNSKGVFGMRPRDVVSEIQWNYVNDGRQRMKDARANLTGRASGSSRENAVPSMFLSNTLGNWLTTLMASDGIGSDRDNFTNTLTKVMENSYEENHFIKELLRVQGVGNGGYFTLRSLSMLDMTFEIQTALMQNRLNVQLLGATSNHDVVQIGVGANWNGRDLNGIWAASLAQSIPAIMSKYFVGKLAFTSTNMTTIGVTVTAVTNLRSPNLAVMNELTEKTIIGEINALILKDLSMTDLIKFDLACEFDMYGDSKLVIRFDGQPAQVFFMPTFCDSLATPVIAHDKTDLANMAFGFEQVMRQVGDNVLGATADIPTIEINI